MFFTQRAQSSQRLTKIILSLRTLRERISTDLRHHLIFTLPVRLKMKIQAVLQYLESIAPPVYQESYDNAGLIVGNVTTEVTNVLCCLDATEAIVEEAISKKCNLIIAHHPIVFKGLKRLNGKNYVERVVIKAIRNDIAIYAIHTNLDNMFVSRGQYKNSGAIRVD